MDMITILLQEIGVQWLGVDQIRSWNGYLTGGHIDKVSCKFAFKLWMKNVTTNSSTWLCLEIGYPRSHVHTFPPWDCHKNGYSGCIPHSQTQDNSSFCFIVFFGILESMAPRFDDLQKGLLHDTCGDGGRYGLNHGFSAQRNGEASGRFSPNPCDMWISMYSTTQINDFHTMIIACEQDTSHMHQTSSWNRTRPYKTIQNPKQNTSSRRCFSQQNNVEIRVFHDINRYLPALGWSEIPAFRRTLVDWFSGINHIPSLVVNPHLKFAIITCEYLWSGNLLFVRCINMQYIFIYNMYVSVSCQNPLYHW